jgi:hypothetical protein
MVNITGSGPDRAVVCDGVSLIICNHAEGGAWARDRCETAAAVKVVLRRPSTFIENHRLTREADGDAERDRGARDRDETDVEIAWYRPNSFSVYGGSCTLEVVPLSVEICDDAP